MYTTAILTISDKGSRGERIDTAGPAIKTILEIAGFQILQTMILPDDLKTIQNVLIDVSDNLGVNMVVTIGGTGFAPRDNTPEATILVCDKMVPGIAEAMRAGSMQFTRRAMLSRAVCGIRKFTLIINLPGSEKAAVENLTSVLDTLPHGLDMLLRYRSECASDQSD